MHMFRVYEKDLVSPVGKKIVKFSEYDGKSVFLIFEL